MRLFLAFAMVLLLCAGQSKAFDPGAPDTVLIDSVVAYVSSGAVVPIRLVNDEPVTGFEVTFAIPHAVLTLDSFSFVGGRAEYIGLRGLIRNFDSSKATVYGQIISEGPLVPGSGLLGRAYFSWSPQTSPQVLPIDSTWWSIPPGIEHSTLLVDTMNLEIKPVFKKGHINIKQDPLRPDSLWVVSTQGNAGSLVSVDLSLFNEKPVHALGLALTWGTDRLTLNSVTFLGTRGDAAVTKTFSSSGTQVLAELVFDDLAPLTAGTGVIARFNFDIDPTCPETTITVDTAVFGFAQPTYVRLTAADGSIEFMPLFTSGTVHVSALTGVGDGQGSALPKSFSLDQNYPNPFNPTTEIQFALPKSSRVRIDIYDILGRNVRTLLDESRTAGVHRVTFDGRSENGATLSTGVYFYRLTTAEFSQSKKMLLLK